MKCTACQQELFCNFKEHYKSDLHKLNVQRQMHCIPPISIQEYEFDGTSSDISIDIGTKKTFDYKEKIEKNIKNNKKINFEVCLFCDKLESYEHYLEHDLADRDIYYLLNKTCFVCNEGFTNRMSMKNHLLTENHRTAVLKDKNLVLENGKVLHNKYNCTGTIATAKHLQKNNQIMNFNPSNKHEKNKSDSEKNKLKISISKNSQKHFRPDWMQ